MTVAHRTADGRHRSLPNGVGFEQGELVRVDYCHPVDHLEPGRQDEELAEKVALLSRHIEWISRGRNAEECGNRFVGMLSVLRPDLAESIRIEKATKSKWAVCFHDEFKVQGQCHLRPQGNRELMRERTKESWRKRKSPPGDNAPNGDHTGNPTYQSQTPDNAGEVNGHEKTAQVLRLEKQIRRLVADHEYSGCEQTRRAIVTAQKQLQSARSKGTK